MAAVVAACELAGAGPSDRCVSLTCLLVRGGELLPHASTVGGSEAGRLSAPVLLYDLLAGALEPLGAGVECVEDDAEHGLPVVDGALSVRFAPRHEDTQQAARLLAATTAACLAHVGEDEAAAVVVAVDVELGEPEPSDYADGRAPPVRGRLSITVAQESVAASARDAVTAVVHRLVGGVV